MVAVKDRWSQRNKVGGDQDSVERYDYVKFKESAQGPIQKTYKHNPTLKQKSKAANS